MFKEKLLDTVEEMDNEYLRSPTLFDPFRNVPVTSKKANRQRKPQETASSAI